MENRIWSFLSLVSTKLAYSRLDKDVCSIQFEKVLSDPYINVFTIFPKYLSCRCPKRGFIMLQEELAASRFPT